VRKLLPTVAAAMHIGVVIGIGVVPTRYGDEWHWQSELQAQLGAVVAVVTALVAVATAVRLWASPRGTGGLLSFAGLLLLPVMLTGALLYVRAGTVMHLPKGQIVESGEGTVPPQPRPSR
jgi:hypothetical protein